MKKSGFILCTVVCLLPIAGLLLFSCSDDDNPAAPSIQYGWAPLGTGMQHATQTASIRALTVYGDKLIAAGKFTTAGGVSANNITAWDGSNWSPLGTGLTGGDPVTQASALTVYDNKLIVGGQFTTAGGVSANYIAVWDGSAWSPLGTGMNGSVLSLTVYDNKLIAGGVFTNAGGISANYIAVWDGSAWSPVGTGIEGGSVYAITVFDDKWIVAGEFIAAGGLSANRAAAWDGSVWSPMGMATTFLARALMVYENELIIGGFYSAGAPGGTFAWNGSAWSPLETETGDTEPNAFALTVYGNRLIAGGNFTAAGGVNANYIAAWDGSDWSPLGTGTDQIVSTLTIYLDKLIAGGSFTTAGGTGAECVAAWGPK